MWKESKENLIEIFSQNQIKINSTKPPKFFGSPINKGFLAQYKKLCTSCNLVKYKVLEMLYFIKLPKYFLLQIQHDVTSKKLLDLTSYKKNKNKKNIIIKQLTSGISLNNA